MLELSPIPFYLLGGMALGAVQSPSITAGFVETTANLGVVLLFVLGLEYRRRNCGPTCTRTRRQG